MIAKLYNALSLFSIATMLALGGFGVFLVLSERLTVARAEVLAAVLRGELDDWNQEAPNGQADASESQPVTEGRRQSRDEVRAARHQDHLRHQMIERALRDVEARQRLLDQALQHLIDQEERLARQEQNWMRRRQELASTVQDQGFEQEMEYVASLPPRQAKAHIINLWRKSRADAVRLFRHLDVSRGRRILAEFKTPDEQQIMSELLEQLRSEDLVGAAAPIPLPDGRGSVRSGTTAGAATP